MKAFLARMTPRLKGMVFKAEMDLVKANMLLLLVFTGAVSGSWILDISFLFNLGAGNDEAEESEEDEHDEEREEKDKSEGDDSLLLSSSSPIDGNCIFNLPSIFLKLNF